MKRVFHAKGSAKTVIVKTQGVLCIDQRAGIIAGFRSVYALVCRKPAAAGRMIGTQSSGCRGKKVGELRARKLELSLLRCKALLWITQHERETRIS